MFYRHCRLFQAIIAGKVYDIVSNNRKLNWGQVLERLEGDFKLEDIITGTYFLERMLGD